MTNKNFAMPLTVEQITELNRCNIRQALKDYLRHTYEEGAMWNIQDAFVDRLALDCAVAKTDLRNIFRRVRGWNEQLQAVVINGTWTHDPDYDRVHDLAWDIVDDKCPPLESLRERIHFSEAMDVFCEPRGAIAPYALRALRELAPHAYRKNRPLNRVFQEFCKAIGVYDAAAGSEYQKLYAQLSDEMKGRKIDFKLFLSINPAHFLTMSNPIDDRRGQMLTSCHSLNRLDYEYGAGNAGYARDDVTFVAFTVANPDNAETLNNRKTRRQLFMYKAGNGLLLQSRLYDANGGTYGRQERGDLFRDLVQRALCEGENAVNLWTTSNYRDNKRGINLPKGKGFHGYPDWLEFGGETIKLSLRKDKVDDYREFTIGTYGLCFICGKEVDDTNYLCEDCNDDDKVSCDECGEGGFDEDELTEVINCHGESVQVCSACLEEFYHLCPYCHTEHHNAHCTETEDGRWVCSDCLEEHYFQCPHCDRWFPYDDGTEVTGGELVCEDCLENYYVQCNQCEEWIHGDDAHFVFTDRDDYYVCDECFEEDYFTCDLCGESFHNDCLNEVTIDGAEVRICDSCRDSHEHEHATA